MRSPDGGLRKNERKNENGENHRKENDPGGKTSMHIGDKRLEKPHPKR